MFDGWENKVDCLPITNCIACGNNNLVPVLDLGNQPLANEYRNSLLETQQVYPLAINLCTDCYHVQLTHQVSPELMFKHYSYVSGTAKTQLDYFDWLVKTILQEYNNTPKNILDIGCNDGSFLNAWKSIEVSTYGVDPAENLYEISSRNHNIHCGFFTGKEFNDIKFDIVTCMNAFAHNSDQLSLLKNIKNRINSNGLIFCTISQVDMIKNGEFDTIYHEHVSFYNVNSAKALCDRAGVNLVNVIKHPIHGGSYILVISPNISNSNKVNEFLKKESEDGLYDIETYKKYAEKSYMVAKLFSETIKEYKLKGIPIVGYGAAAKGNTFLNFSGEKIDFIIDDNPLKHLKYTPGIGCPVYSIDYLEKNYKKDKTICFIPLAWNFYDEIVEKIKTVRSLDNYEDVFVKYFPTFEVYK